MAPVAPRFGDAIFAILVLVNAELFTLTYGAIVRRLITDLEDVEEVNKQLDQIFLAKSNVSRCIDFKETAEGTAKVSMKTEVTWVRDMLRSDDVFELQVKLLKQIPEQYPYMDDE